jgi:hypothetical protein
MELIPAPRIAQIDTWIGWYEPYATSHDALDQDKDLFTEVGNAARALSNLVAQIRAGVYRPADAGLEDPREK